MTPPLVRAPRFIENVKVPPKLSIVVPAFNEAARLGGSLRQILKYLSERRERSELIVVDDGSTDLIAQTGPLITRWRRLQSDRSGRDRLTVLGHTVWVQSFPHERLPAIDRSRANRSVRLRCRVSLSGAIGATAAARDWGALGS